MFTWVARRTLSKLILRICEFLKTFCQRRIRGRTSGKLVESCGQLVEPPGEHRVRRRLVGERGERAAKLVERGRIGERIHLARHPLDAGRELSDGSGQRLVCRRPRCECVKRGAQLVESRLRRTVLDLL